MNKRLNKFGEMLGEFLSDCNISINEYAYRINTTPKNLIDIIEGRVALSENIISNISCVSSIPVSFIYNTETSYKIDNEIDDYVNKNNLTLKQFINKFNYKELKERQIVDFRNERNDYAILEDILKFLRFNNPKLIYNEDNKIFYKSKNDKPELLALWLEMCYKETFNQKVKEYKRENIANLINFIKEEASKNSFNEKKLIKLFNDNGIFLCIIDDLKGSKIRGAFRVLRDKPAIYITRKHKRYADIYFALLHEIAHLNTDYNRAKKGSIVSLMDTKETEDYEIKADQKALNWMVDDVLYSYILDDIKTKDIKKVVDSYNTIKSFLVYRLAKDKKIDYSSKIYQDNNPLIKESL